MRRAWFSFINHHNPNHRSMSPWPDYRDGPQNMVFESDATAAEVDDFRSEGMDIWIEERIAGCSGLRA